MISLRLFFQLFFHAYVLWFGARHDFVPIKSQVQNKALHKFGNFMYTIRFVVVVVVLLWGGNSTTSRIFVRWNFSLWYAIFEFQVVGFLHTVWTIRPVVFMLYSHLLFTHVLHRCITAVSENCISQTKILPSECATGHRIAALILLVYRLVNDVYFINKTDRFSSVLSVSSIISAQNSCLSMFLFNIAYFRLSWNNVCILASANMVCQNWLTFVNWRH